MYEMHASRVQEQTSSQNTCIVELSRAVHWSVIQCFLPIQYPIQSNWFLKNANRSNPISTDYPIRSNPIGLDRFGLDDWFWAFLGLFFGPIFWADFLRNVSINCANYSQ